MITISIGLTVYITCILFVRLRNRVNFPLARQLSDFSTFMVPFNIPAYVLSKVPTQHRLDQKHFPELQPIQDNWTVIRDEALALYENGYIAAKEDLPASTFYKDNRWTSFYLKVYETNIPSARALAPKTMALIDQVPSMNIALFACLNPGKSISQHHDPFAFSIRYSLGLSTPNCKESGIIVNGEDTQWADGKSILFDETYLHSIYNQSDKPRIILMTDVDRPLSIRWIQTGYYLFGRIFNSLFFVDNLDPTKTGLGNKLGVYLNMYKRALKKFKHWNKPLYILFKLAVIIGIIIIVML